MTGREFLLDHLAVPGVQSLDGYRRAGGFAALTKALRSLSPAEVRAEISRSGLRGRGGSCYPSGLKVEAMAQAADPERYVVMNGEEGGPGAFKDGRLLQGSPFLILEGILLAGFAAGARHGICIIRKGAKDTRCRFQEAVGQMTEQGLVGTDILGRGFAFELRVEIGAGVFCCGEETALLESAEGRRGHPRVRPPYPVERGFQGHPTLVSNVETLANVPFIIDRGADWFRGIGLPAEPGTRVLSVSGHIRHPGVYEVPTGTPLRRVLELAGGARPGEEIVAVLPGGAVSGFLPARDFDAPVSQEGLERYGTCLSSGAVIVFSDRCCFVQVAQRLAAFFEQESCGRCTPCREGTARLREILEDISGPRRKTAGEGRRDAWREVPPPRPFALLEPLVETISRASACGLGRSAGVAITSALRLFPDEFAAHFERQECPRQVCWK
ncbi:MAG: NADH-quinone oxidoreductase subunit J/K [Candidatus Riflebacteria bacterium]|nr:NADH-quinone oxidoreductase subunit J/K [Candidatus Riflebacteria bacterium]